VLSAGGNGAIQVMYVQSGRHARHFLVNQPAAFDGRLVVGLYREQIVMTKWGTHGILGGGKVCFLETGDMLNGANWIPVTRLKSFLLRADSIIRARSHPEAFAGPTRWKVRPKCLDSTRRAYATGMASICPERRHPALSIQTNAARSRSTCSLALHSRCQRCVLVARVIKTDESLLFTTQDTCALRHLTPRHTRLARFAMNSTAILL
jgi:hypothetical protein